VAFFFLQADDVAAVTRALCVSSALMLTAVLTYGQEKPAQRYTEQVDVERVLVDVRVLDNDGRAVVGLGADDFSVKIGGKPVAIESAMWVGGAQSDGGSVKPETVEHAAAVDDGLSGRLIIFLFQKDLEPSRLTGLMRMLMESQGFLDGLTPRDRVAVLSFDSQLKIWLDFTNDRDAIRDVFQRRILFGDPEPLLPGPVPSLVSRLDSATASKTYTIEKALHRIADAVRGLPGSKSIVFIGHGFGRLGWTGVSMEHDYDEARDALLAARTSVFSLDVTHADAHSLEAGLRLVSRETGGFFARTHLFTGQAMNRLSGVLAGYYVLFLEQPTLRPGTHDVSVRLTRRPGTVLARESYLSAR
jgi:VWFA-related protein